MASLYLHIPFCKTKCCYCAFNSFSAMGELYEPYVSAVKMELSRQTEKEKRGVLDTLFIGGGTPTVLEPDQLVQLIKHAQTLFGFARDIEVSLEANPGTVSEADLIQLKNGGVNRLSLGVQSFDDQELRILGRCHTRSDAEKAIKAAQNTGIVNISLDLMYGLPGQTSESWRRSLDTARALGLKHLSMYQLTVEEGTVLEKYIDEGNLFLPGEDDIAEMDRLTDQFVGETRLNQYEISNYAENGSECRHNVNYWLNQEYFSAGAGSVSYLSGLREKRVSDPAEYVNLISEGSSAILESEKLSVEASFRESVVMGLRMNRGVSLRELYSRYSIDLKEYYGDTLTRLVNLSLVILRGDRLRITTRGRPFANAIMSELV
jgi:oxygen-independent coproporphyrinogen-3 oxidase